MAYADLTQKDHDLLLRLAREQATKALAAAERALTNYVDYLRQDAERRLNAPAGGMRVLDDPAYDQILSAYGTLRRAQDQVEAVAAVPRGTREG